jgi:tetratricopeptide (TPR) repeat protein
MRIPSSSIATVFLSLVLLSLPSPAAEETSALARAEAAWARRAEGHVGAVAAAEPIEEAINALREALVEDPGNLAIESMLLKALWFKGEHVALAPDAQLAVFENARNTAQATIERLLAGLPNGGKDASAETIAAHLSDTAYAAETYFWGAAHWGLWGRYRGKIASARQGVAGKIRDYSQVVIALNENVEGAGGPRILGRLHTEAPKLPFVTGWIDRQEAVRQLERSVELAPDDLLNRLYYLEALIEFDKSRRSEAIQDLRTFVKVEPNPDTIVEDLKILGEAKALLDRVDR